MYAQCMEHKRKAPLYYDPQDFKIHSVIGSGGFASVHIARWKNTRSKFAIKKFTKSSTTEEIITNEVYLMEKAKHPNIIRFYGITKLKDEINYSLVLEYADGGTLREYLRKNATTIKWEAQLNFAEEISSAILCLHEHKIVHRDLHPGNILIHQNMAKLADFGNSYLQGSDCYTKAYYGVIPYVDPKFFNIEKSESHSYFLTEKSDIYSLGMIFWELTSCSSPFNFETTTDFQLIMLEIFNGKREDPVPNTNAKFIELYQKCWQHEPDKRPDIHQVISELDDINSGNNNDISTNFDSKENVIIEESENEEFPDDGLLELQLTEGK